jgi:predicted  nucleic acid-binding Zn-ribbon protein
MKHGGLQAREEASQLGKQLASAMQRVSNGEVSLARVRNEQHWLQKQKQAAETTALRLQKSYLDVASKLEALQKEHEQAVDEVAFQRDRVKVRTPAWHENVCPAGVLL